MFLKDVERDNRGPQLILTRANEAFVEYLFRQEVPEMETGAVEIRAIAREAGKRTKLAVASTVPGVDPVGTFVGGHGTRVNAVAGEQEKSTLSRLTPTLRTLSPMLSAQPRSPRSRSKTAPKSSAPASFVNEDQQSIAIGRGGQNVRLASKLTGYELDITPAGSITPVAVAAPKADKKPRKNIEDDLFSAIEETTEAQE